MTPWPTPTLRHVGRLTDDVGVVEHARMSRPRPDLGYCTDDAGRALGLASQMPDDPDAPRIAAATMRFLERAHEGEGRFRLRANADGTWTDDPSSDDACGRALLGLGTAAASAPWPDVRRRSLQLFEEASLFRSPHRRARAYAALGGAAVLDAMPNHPGAAGLVLQALDLLQGTNGDPSWLWPEDRLTYANALLPDAALASAIATGKPDVAKAALAALGWLVQAETDRDRFSFTPVGGRGPDETRPAYDQQPIEAWAMSDACRRAYALTGNRRWAWAVDLAADWFLGRNDRGVEVWDPQTGGGFDGLEPRGVNRNQGAESSLAFVAAMVNARSVTGTRPRWERDQTAARASIR